MWTPDALRSKAHPFAQNIWRMVELQSQALTMRLTDSYAEQELLEDILEETKPSFPSECDGLHYLLKTPFRYEPYRVGSRFRRAGQREGVFYGALKEETAVAEASFYTLLFFLEAPNAQLPQKNIDYTAFQVSCETTMAIDLSHPPFDEKKPQWTDPTDYTHCQDFADIARQAKIELIIYEAVRTPTVESNIALLSPLAFKRKQPLTVSSRTWSLHVTREEVRAFRHFPRHHLTFAKEIWKNDHRLQHVE
ncbi:MAG: RES family NAD+ phosphorylase, partial [Pseudomonadota bacterium]